jgi:hypothetical protein
MSTDTPLARTGATHVRDLTDRSVAAWKQTVQGFTEQAGLAARLPRIGLTEPVDRYFEFLQQMVDANRELAAQWAELVAALSGSVRDQVDRVTVAVAEHADAIADLAVAPARAAREKAGANTSSVGTE